MKRSIDSPDRRICYGQRFATVEPVFGNLRYNCIFRINETGRFGNVTDRFGAT